MGNVMMEASQINYRGGETKMSVEEALKSTSGEAAAIAQLQTDVGDLQTTKANLITIAPVFSAETAYDPGDLVYYNGLTYRCVNAHEGEWDADDFAATTVANELSELKSGLTKYTSVPVTTNNNGGAQIDVSSYIPAGSTFLTAMACKTESGGTQGTVTYNTSTKILALIGGTAEAAYTVNILYI